MRNPIILYPVILLYLFLTGFAGSSRHVVAQTLWAPVGATWHFTVPYHQTWSYVLYESTEDSVINGLEVSVIEVKLNGTEPVSQEYIYQHGDSVFYYNIYHNSFFLLYNFAASAGDTITVHDSKFKPTPAFFCWSDSINDFKYKILDADSIFISNRWIRRQYVKPLSNDWGFTYNNEPSYIMDGMGSETYFFGESKILIPKLISTMLRCYDEPGFSYVNPSWNHPCDYLLAVDEVPVKDVVLVGPNPFADELTVSYSEPIEFVEIFTTEGSRIWSGNPGQKKVSVNTSSFSRGCYLLKICSKHHVFTRTIIKR